MQRRLALIKLSGIEQPSYRIKSLKLLALFI